MYIGNDMQHRYTYCAHIYIEFTVVPSLLSAKGNLPLIITDFTCYTYGGRVFVCLGFLSFGGFVVVGFFTIFP